MLNKTSKAVRLATLGALAAGALSVAPVASAEVEVAGSVSIASMYLWRGLDLGQGNGTDVSGGGVPAISGDIVVSSAGFYGGLWGSSGDINTGTEYDIFVGFGGEAGDFAYDIMAANYIYPSTADAPGNVLDDFGGLSEVILTLGFGPVSFQYYDNVAGGSGYEYYTLGGSAGAFSATVGYHDFEEAGADMTHLDLGSAYNDNLSFTLSQVVDTEENTYDEDLKFVVSYSLPIE